MIWHGLWSCAPLAALSAFVSHYLRWRRPSLPRRLTRILAPTDRPPPAVVTIQKAVVPWRHRGSMATVNGNVGELTSASRMAGISAGSTQKASRCIFRTSSNARSLRSMVTVLIAGLEGPPLVKLPSLCFGGNNVALARSHGTKRFWRHPHRGWSRRGHRWRCRAILAVTMIRTWRAGPGRSRTGNYNLPGWP